MDDNIAPATKADIALVLNEFRKMRAEAEAVKQDLTGIMEGLAGLKQDVAGLKQGLAGVKQDVESVKQDVESLKRDVESLKQDVESLKQDVAFVKQDLEDFKVEVNMRFQEFEHRMGQQLLDMEGKIITSSYRLAESMQQRMKQNEGNQAAFNARFATLEERLLEVEKRLNIPPQQQQQ